MAIIGIRDLVHTSKDVLARVEDDKEPFLITRRGQPVAALVPVDAAEAERYVLASAPALVESRRSAEERPRRARPIGEVAEHYGIEPSEPGSSIEALSGGMEIVASLRPFVGRHVAEQYAEKADQQLGSITDKVLKTAEGWGLFESDSASDRAVVSARVHALNQRLLGLEVRTLLKEAVGQRLEGLGWSTEVEETSDDASEGVFGSSLADEAVDEAVQRVDVVNQRIFTLVEQDPSAFSLAAYELSVRTGIEMLGSRMPAYGAIAWGEVRSDYLSAEGGAPQAAG